MKLKLIAILLLANQAFAQSERSYELKTSIEGVTVFLQNAQISRKGAVNIKPGRSTIFVKSLSPHLDAKSIRVKATGPFTILSVNHKFNYLDELKNNAKVDSLLEIVESIEIQIEEGNSRLEVLLEKQSLLNENKKLGGESTATSLSELKQAIDFYDKELMTIKSGVRQFAFSLG